MAARFNADKGSLKQSLAFIIHLGKVSRKGVPALDSEVTHTATVMVDQSRGHVKD